jgi:hypothetical protein
MVMIVGFMLWLTWLSFVTVVHTTGVFVPMVDLVAEISQTALSNTVHAHQNMVQVL